MSDYGLPTEAKEFLKSGQQFHYDATCCEAGLVTLKTYDELKLTEIWVNSEASPIQEDDPHAGEEGYYVIPCVDLIATCEGYDPEGILIWLPGYQVFGQWDCDHWDVVIFPSTKWTNIVANPAHYLGAQWDGSMEGQEYLRPWNQCEFKVGRPF